MMMNRKWIQITFIIGLIFVGGIFTKTAQGATKRQTIENSNTKPVTPSALELASSSIEIYPALTPSTPSCANYWYAFNDGTYDAWLTLNAEHPNQSTNSGLWQPSIPKTGTYKVEAYIATHGTIHACGLTYDYDTSNAKYTINHAGGSTNVTANQKPGRMALFG